MSERWRRRSLELFCPAEFHHISGDDVCLQFCRKKKCSVFKNLQKSSPISIKNPSVKRISRVALPKYKLDNLCNFD